MTRPRQTVGALSPTMRSVLVGGHGPILTVRALSDRGIAAMGLSLRPTPLGRQIARMLRDLHYLRQDLERIELLLGKARVGAVPTEVLNAHAIALRSLARHPRWLP